MRLFILGMLASGLAMLAGHGPARAEPTEIRLAQTRALGFLPLMVVQREKLIEKHAAALGLPGMKVTWNTFAGPANSMDALLSGNVDVIGVGSTSLLLVWAKTVGTASEIKGIASVSDVPIFLNTTNPALRSLADYTDKDRISVSSIKVSVPAIVLQMAAARMFGDAHYDRLDPLTVSLGVADAATNLLSFRGEITSDLTSPPFSHVELENPRVHKVLDSRDVIGPASITVSVTTTRFRQQNPKASEAILLAFKEAAALIVSDPEKAMDAYYEATGDRRTSRASLLAILRDPRVSFGLTPHGIMRFATFMADVSKVLTRRPDTWQAVFFPGNHLGQGD